MALFLKQTEQRSQLQSKIAADLRGRLQTKQLGPDAETGETKMDESSAATGRSLFWVGVVTMVVIAMVVFVLFASEGI